VVKGLRAGLIGHAPAQHHVTYGDQLDGLFVGSQRLIVA
jgi:hypothetical protein